MVSVNRLAWIISFHFFSFPDRILWDSGYVQNGVEVCWAWEEIYGVVALIN